MRQPVNHNRTKISNNINNSSTLIDDLPSEEDEDEDENNFSNDRYKNPRQISRIRQDSGNYIQDDSLFRESPPSSVQMNRKAIKTNESGNIMAKAKALAKDRESDSSKQQR
jgi:hypothetical protein